MGTTLAIAGRALLGGLRRTWRGAKPKLLGLGFLVVVAGLIGLCIAAYQKRFTPVTMVTLQADRAGNQLSQNADVKIRGLVVGEVRTISSTGSGAVLQLALHPEDTRLIPADVQARILPKTLFGEKFVDLVTPPGETGARPIRAGDVIPQDRSQTAIELGRVFDDVVPLLRTVQPAKLNSTLTAVATALQDRGNPLGDNLVRADTYFKGLNPALGDLNTDISGLADLADNLDQAAPQFFELLKQATAETPNVLKNNNDLLGFLRGTTAFAGTTQRVLQENEANLIKVGQVGRPTLETLRDYGQEIPFVFQGLTQLTPRINDALGGQGPFLHISAQVVPDRGVYTREADCPRYPDTGGQTAKGPNCTDFVKGAPNGAAPVGYTDPRGTAAEHAEVAALVSPVVGMPAQQVPGLADLLFAPAMRGTEVSVQ